MLRQRLRGKRKPPGRSRIGPFLIPVQGCESSRSEQRQNQDGQGYRQKWGARRRGICVNLGVHRPGIHVIAALAMLTKVASIAFNCFPLTIPNAACIGLNKAPVKYSTWQPLEIVCFDGLQIMDRNPGLIADFAYANPALLACESQLFADTRCHFQSLDSWRWL